MPKRYALKGVNDEATECCVCGKVELKRVMWLVELDGDGNELGEPFHCGTTCGAKLMNVGIAKVRKAADSFALNVAHERMMIEGRTKEYRAAMAINHEIISEVGFARRQEHTRYAEMMQLRETARQIARNAEIRIEL